MDPDLLSNGSYSSLYRSILREHQQGGVYWDNPRAEFRNPGWTALRRQENIRDWQTYFGAELPVDEIDRFIYRTPLNILDSIRRAIDNDEPSNVGIRILESRYGDPDTIDVRSVVREIERNRDTELLNYLTLALQSNRTIGGSNPWDSDTVDPLQLKKLLTEARLLYDNTSSPFLRLRVGFQIVRLARYANLIDEVSNLYSEYVDPIELESPIRWRALGHVAGAHRIEGDTALSNYLFSRVFANAEGEREIVVRDFRVSDEETWKRTLSNATTNDERALLWMLRGFKERRLSFEYLKEMLDVAPSSPYVAIALMRELHRIESYLYDDMVVRDYDVVQAGYFERFDYEADSTRKTNVEFDYVKSAGWKRHIGKGKSWDSLFWYNTIKSGEKEEIRHELVLVQPGREYVSSFRKFVLSAAEEAPVLEPALWFMVAGYVDMMDGDFGQADECLAEADRSVRTDYDLKQQIRLLDQLRRAQSEGAVTGSVRERIAESLRWMQQKQKENRHTKYNKVVAELGRQHLVEGDVPRAILAFQAAGDPSATAVLLDMYATDSDLKALADLIASGGGDEYDRMMIDSFSLDRYQLMDVRATRMMRRGEIRSAAQLYQQLPENYWIDQVDAQGVGLGFGVGADYDYFATSEDSVRLNGVDLIPATWGASDLDSVLSAMNGERFSRKSFATRIVRILDSVDAGELAGSKAHMKIGNLMFNTPYWGYNGAVWDGGLLFLVRWHYYSPYNYPFNVPGVAERMLSAHEVFMDEYGSRKQARQYYRLALEESRDRETQARAAYMMDICLKRPQTSLHEHIKADDQDRTGYDLIRTDYRETDFAQAILSACSVYKQFEESGN